MAPRRDNFYLSALLGSLLSWSAMAFKAEVQDEICCNKFLAMRWKKSDYGQFLPNYRTVSLCSNRQSAFLVVHKTLGNICLNLDRLWVKDLKDYIDKARKSASRPTAVKQLGNNHITTEAHPRSLHSTADWGSTHPTETTLGSTETPTWTLLDRQPVTATSDQTPAVKLPTPVVETSEGISPVFPGSTQSLGKAGQNSGSEIPHNSSSVPLTSPSLASGCNHSEEGCLEKRAFSTVISPEIPERHMGQMNQKMVILILISIIIILSLLAFAIYKGCKKSTSGGFNYHPTQTSSDEMGVPRWTQPA
ncbi:uncharacterized protein LOC132397001 isoform X2 [Hypanus sabinus]|uniref:uncharacterized protein LOC132397001 isoform X2 n=1 Tax=Hypanus sabinus TaxID=79690 RepID=UPI0028C37B9C|nr:uncharacterized protein LOC132397001 isoform X2 [Hypanus sabinus]